MSAGVSVDSNNVVASSTTFMYRKKQVHLKMEPGGNPALTAWCWEDSHPRKHEVAYY